jgi:hypothetical protein
VRGEFHHYSPNMKLTMILFLAGEPMIQFKPVVSQ